VWTDPEIRTLLEETLAFASGDTYSFEFVYQPEDQFPKFLNFPSEIVSKYKYDEVLLFSGGLDSFAGVVEEVVANKNHPILVSHQSNNKLVGLQRTLFAYVIGLCKSGLKPLHVPVMINKKKELT